MRETWKAVSAGRYEVSSLGRVRSLDCIGADGRRWRGRLLRPTNVEYRQVTLAFDGILVYRRVHLLVSRAFLGPCPRGHEVNHKNGKKHDNRAANLEYRTRAGNQEHAAKFGLMPTKANGRWRRAWRA
jgi:hypothetical protein